jgi:hypothetical protein
LVGVRKGAADPLAGLLDAAEVVPPPVCPDCEQPEELVPPVYFWYACPRCHPDTFDREAALERRLLSRARAGR